MLKRYKLDWVVMIPKQKTIKGQFTVTAPFWWIADARAKAILRKRYPAKGANYLVDLRGHIKL